MIQQVYVNFLASSPTAKVGLRYSVNRNLADLLELHEEILKELRDVVPHPETASAAQLRPLQSICQPVGHSCRVSCSQQPLSRLRDIPTVLAEPRMAAEVSQVFLKRVSMEVMQYVKNLITDYN